MAKTKAGKWLEGNLSNTGKKLFGIETEEEKLLNNRPEYKIDPSYAANKAIATNLAYGRSRAVTNAEASIDQSTANALSAARDASGTSGSLMSAIVNAAANQNSAYNQLAGQEATLQQQGMGTLMQAGTALAEEKDKAWNYNVNQPYQQKLAEEALKKQRRQQTLQSILSVVGTVGGAVLGGPAGAAIGSKLGGVAGKAIVG